MIPFTFTPNKTPHRGFTLFVAVILSSVVLSIGLALLDVAYKEIILSSTGRQSQYAFYNADSALECGVFYDSGGKTGISEFDFATGAVSGTVSCDGVVANYSDPQTSSPRISTFSIPCADGVGILGTVTVYKYSPPTTDAAGRPLSTAIYATGYNTCNASDPGRIERGEKAYY
ncbi:hypothetical protein H0X32_00690 [Patescibacteria group bacterium]|nr:hypothetical protein [Patescibacteria group bacterium]